MWNLLWSVLSCQSSSLEERWAQSPIEVIDQSESLSSLEQQKILRWVQSERPKDLERFCELHHSTEVEFRCNLLENRPHLLDQKSTSKKSILHSYRADDTQRTTKEAFLLVQEKDSITDISKICNGISESELRSECYFVAADSFLQKKGQENFEKMISLCLATDRFVSYCLSHIHQRLDYPSFSDREKWMDWEQRFVRMETSKDVDVRSFMEELKARLAFRVVGEMSSLCWLDFHNETKISTKLREAMIFWGFYRQGNKRDFASALKDWKVLFFPTCTQIPNRTQISNFPEVNPVPFSGSSTLFFDGFIRPFHSELEIDVALLLVESAYFFQDRFVLQDAMKHPAQIIHNRARQLLFKLEQ